MQKQESDSDVQSEDYERQSSGPTYFEMEYRVNTARVDERIKTIQTQLIRHDERMTQLENDLKSISKELIKTIRTELNPYNTKLERIDNDWKKSVKWWIIFTLTIIGIFLFKG